MTCPVSHGEMILEKVKIPPAMQAVQMHKFGGPDVLQLTSGLPMPKANVSQVLIRVLTVGVNPYETYQRSGSFAGNLPVILGSDCAGIVAQTGPGVKKFTIGDRVFTTKTVSGSYAEYAVAEEAYTFPLHENLSFSQGAALGVPYFTAYKTLFLRAHCKPGQTVLIHGASGGVGIACCQIARGHGLRVFGTAGTDKGLMTVRENGAHAVFNHREKGYVSKIQECAGDGGVDIICEMSGSKNWNADLSLLANRGHLIIIGSPPGKASFNPGELIGLEKRVEGVSVYSSSQEEYAEMAAALYAGVDAGWVRPVVCLDYPLKEAADAHREVMEHKEPAAGKIIISIC